VPARARQTSLLHFTFALAQGATSFLYLALALAQSASVVKKQQKSVAKKQQNNS